MNTKTEEIQQQIREFIKAHPGVYRSKIAETLDLKLSEIEHHLQQLEHTGKITCTDDNGIKRYYYKDTYKPTTSTDSSTTKERIYSLIAQRPGLYQRKIAKLLHMSTQLADYHLSQMEKNNDIIAVKTIGHNKRYYLPEHRITQEEKKILEVLAKKIPLEIVTLLLKHDTLQHKTLLQHLNLSPSLLTYHLSKLLENDIIHIQPYGQEKGFTLLNRKEIIRILKKYRLILELDIAIENFKGIWNDFYFDDQ